MVRTQLKYNNLAEIVGSDGLAIITLTDEPASRAIHIVCDQAIRNQLQMRANQLDVCNSMLPEVLTAMLEDYIKKKKLEITIYDVKDGQYLTTLMNTDNFSIRKIRLSDAVLLHVVAGVPVFIDEKLMASQSAPFQPDMSKISIPINTLDTDKLQAELEKAVEEENYRLASYIKEELNKRNHVEQS